MFRLNETAVRIHVSKTLETKSHFNIVFIFKLEVYVWICFVVGYYTSTTELTRAKTTYAAVNILFISLHTA